MQLTLVPQAVAAQLDTGYDGLMVRNVVKGSPSDGAGIERYDVIIEADGKKLSGDILSFVDHVRGKKAGEPLSLVLYRHGKQMNLTVNVAEAPHQRVELKYPEDQPDVLFKRDFGLRGRILKPGPGGNWVWEDLENLPDVRDMLRERMRGRGWQWGKGPASRPSSEAEARRVDKNGNTLQVRRLPDGSIEVRRSHARAEGPNARDEVKTYPNFGALKNADPEAVLLLNTLPPPEAGQPPRPPMPPAPPGEAGQSNAPSVTPQAPPPPPRPDIRERPAPPPRPRPPAPLEAPKRAPRTGPNAPPAPPTPPGEPRPGMAPPPGPGEPMVSFDVEQDGSITVHSRQGDAELNVTYPSREVFKQKAPKLFERFEKMEDALR